LHEIVLEPLRGAESDTINHRWLGLAFRQSKNLFHFQNGQPYFSSGQLLVLVDKGQSLAFLQSSAMENCKRKEWRSISANAKPRNEVLMEPKHMAKWEAATMPSCQA
jgi:hypothetical protein